MAPAVTQGSATTALAILALTLALDNRIRLESAAPAAPPDPAAPRRQLSEGEDEPLAHELRGEMEELRGTVAGQQATLAELYEVLLEEPPRSRRGAPSRPIATQAVVLLCTRPGAHSPQRRQPFNTSGTALSPCHY